MEGFGGGGRSGVGWPAVGEVSVDWNHGNVVLVEARVRGREGGTGSGNVGLAVAGTMVGVGEARDEPIEARSGFKFVVEGLGIVGEPNHGEGGIVVRWGSNKEVA